MLDRSLAPASGLTSHEANARLAQYGPNEPAPAGHWTWMAELRSQLLSPLVLILQIGRAHV